jgi:hypothetical protein
MVERSSSRSFGLLACAVLAFVGLRPLLGGGAVRWWALALAAALLLVSLANPGLLDVPNRLWLRLGKALSRIVNPVVLGILFFVVITPMALISRLLGRDPLRLGMDRDAATYWIDRTSVRTGPVDLRKQF